MKASPFEYHRAGSVEEACNLLARHGDDAKLLAGGQSLVPMMNLRLVAPRVLIDINEISELRYLSVDASHRTLSIGALTPHAEFERPLPTPAASLSGVLRDAARCIGHAPIRTRGTFGGSLAHGDPVAEWCVIALALDATLLVARVGGNRVVPIDEFFRGFLTTALSTDEMIQEIRVPIGSSSLAFAEISRRHGDFALVAAAATVSSGRGGVCQSVRIAVGGVGSTPLRLPRTESLLRGEVVNRALLREASEAAAQEVAPVDDIHAGADQRRAMTRRLVGTVLRECLSDGRETLSAPLRKERRREEGDRS